jgi:hypothetical protein
LAPKVGLKKTTSRQPATAASSRKSLVRVFIRVYLYPAIRVPRHRGGGRGTHAVDNDGLSALRTPDAAAAAKTLTAALGRIRHASPRVVKIVEPTLSARTFSTGG